MREVIDKLFSKKEAGARLGAYGFFIALLGGVLEFAGLTPVGYVVGLAGTVVGVGGVVMHFVANWRSIFRTDR